jgi:DNA-binding transcriptional ArsR family regulator
MDLEQAARCMESLGNAKRLEIVRLLVKAGNDGLAVGQIQRALGIPASTLSHHILSLVAAGLVTRQREGRTLRCLPDFDRLRGLTTLLFAECCAGVADTTPTSQAV